MRSVCRISAVLFTAVAGAVLVCGPASAVDPLNPYAPCSVFDRTPCNPSFCGVFDPWPCVPIMPPFGQNLQLTIHSRNGKAARAPEGPVNTLGDLFTALRTCWEPPPLDVAVHGMQMSVLFSFKRTGEIIAAPRVTYASSDAKADARRVYSRAIEAAIERCTPMPFGNGMGNAIAGRPIAIRFVDDRPAD